MRERIRTLSACATLPARTGRAEIFVVGIVQRLRRVAIAVPQRGYAATSPVAELPHEQDLK
ncbi:MAG: hypothetical protein WD049_07605 [Candidatus Paceibacterota bacterium]